MAGSVEEDEEPEDCIRREMMEEVGYRAGKLTLVASGYVSPGSSSERIFLYYAPVKTADLVDPKASGLAAEKEDVKRVEFTREDFLARIDEAAFHDAKVMALGFWLKAQPRQGKPAERASSPWEKSAGFPGNRMGPGSPPSGVMAGVAARGRKLSAQRERAGPSMHGPATMGGAVRCDRRGDSVLHATFEQRGRCAAAAGCALGAVRSALGGEHRCASAGWRRRRAVDRSRSA